MKYFPLNIFKLIINQLTFLPSIYTRYLVLIFLSKKLVNLNGEPADIIYIERRKFYTAFQNKFFFNIQVIKPLRHIL